MPSVVRLQHLYKKTLGGIVMSCNGVLDGCTVLISVNNSSGQPWIVEEKGLTF